MQLIFFILYLTDLYGKTNEDMTTNDIVMETVNDVRNVLVRAHFEQDEAKKVMQRRDAIQLYYWILLIIMKKSITKWVVISRREI